MQSDDFQRGYFPTTHWSQVAMAGLSSLESRRRALGTLLTRYLPALKAHLIFRLRTPSDRADDLLQSFITDKVLERNLIARADQRLGKFRTFLSTALDRFVIDQVRRSRAKKRQGDAPPVGLEDVEEPSITDRTSVELDTAWAREVLAEALHEMECACGVGRPEVWGVFCSRVLDPITKGTPAASYEEIVARFGFESPVEASNVLVTAKRMFSRHLRAVVGEYAKTVEEIEEEIVHLRSILAESSAGAQGAHGI